MGISGDALMTARLIITIIEFQNGGIDLGDDGKEGKFLAGGVVFATGGMLLLGSIPFAIAFHYVSKVASIAANNGTMEIYSGTYTKNRIITGIKHNKRSLILRHG